MPKQDEITITRGLLSAGYASLQAGRPDDAKAAFLAYLQIDSSSPEPHLALSSVAAAECDWTAALTHAERGLAAAPQSSFAAQRVAQSLIDNKRFATARLFLSKAIGTHPQSSALFEVAGMLEFNAGDPFVASTLIEAAIARGMPYRPHVYHAAVSLLCLTGEFDRARRLLDSIAPEQARDLRSDVSTSEQQWAEIEASLTDKTASQGTITAALAQDNIALASHLLCRLFAAHGATSGDYLFVANVAFGLSARGFNKLNELITKGKAAAILIAPWDADAIMAFAESLIQRCAFSDAAQLYLNLAGRPERPAAPDVLLRMLLLCFAAGVIDLGSLRQALPLVEPHVENVGLLAYTDRTVALFSGTLAGTTVPEASLIRRSFVRRPLIRPRIALCLSGQLRGYAAAWERTRRTLERFDVTVFVTTWPRTGIGIGAQGNMDRVLPAGLIGQLPTELRSREIIEARYPSLYRLAQAAGAAVDEADLREVYGTKHICLLDEDAFERQLAQKPGLMAQNSLNQAKMYYAMYRCLSARAINEAEAGIFDVVIRVRPDRALQNLSDRDLWAVCDRRVYRTDHFYGWAVGDQAGIMSSAVADEVQDIWPAIESAGTFACFPGASGRAAEWLMGETLVGQGVAVEQLEGTEFSGLLSTTLEPGEVLSALMKDVDGRARDEVDSAIIETAARTVLQM